MYSQIDGMLFLTSPKTISNICVVLVSLVVKMGDSVLCWPEGLGFVPRAGQSMWYGVQGLSLTTD